MVLRGNPEAPRAKEGDGSLLAVPKNIRAKRDGDSVSVTLELIPED